MYEFKELAPNIFYFTNAIAEPKRLVELIEATENDESINQRFISKWRPWRASNQLENIYGYEKTCNVDYKAGEVLPSPKELYILNSINSNMKFCSSMYKEFNNIEGEVNIDYNFGIKKYDTGQELGPHADQYDGNTKLRYSLVAYLNDDYEGGELAFANQNVIIKPSAGSIVIFPSSEPYLHESRKLISGTKYMCPGFWLW
jgi:hypothetical protein